MLHQLIMPIAHDFSWTRPLFNLTEREYQTLCFLAQGQSGKRVSQRMEVSVETTRKYINVLLRRTNTHSQQELLSLLLAYS
ncbi:LuxR C-terminal-related transcriptional regulator [Vibrio sp. qd031]|uniref:helix-turn-helix transcriptional regulator n=1 Tax=Vibrio sp. qd031 TaxID=1603038 RepID=UPI0015582BFD|nr:LuxR C-terminal-related transcriptional regulator [Vibrio sp. qd031]